MLSPIRAGSDVIFEIKIVDFTAGFPTPYDPESVTLQLRDSAGNLSGIGVLSTSVVGYWTVQHYIDAGATPGPYTCIVTAVAGGSTVIIGRFVCFVVTRGFAIDCGVFFPIKDQSDHLWYWWVNQDHTIDWSDIPPLGVVPPDPALVPSWLEISNPLPSLRYVYPVLDGAPTVTSTVLPNGFGFVGSPAFTTLDQAHARIIVNIADESDITIL